MELLVESAVRGTVLAAGVAVLLGAWRLASPRIVHRAWAGVAVVMLVLPAIVRWGPEAPLPLLAPGAPVVTADAEPDRAVADGSAAMTTVTAVEPRPPVLDWELVVMLLYTSGLVLLLLRLGFGIRQARALVRDAELVGGRLTHPACVTPVTVGLLAPVVILPSDWPEWTAAELAAVLAHEEEHVRRLDPLVAFVTLLNRAVFWFHPLAWWLQRNVSNLAEQACDEVVISQGHDPEAYTASLLKFAKTMVGAGRRVEFMGTAMPGTGLEARLRMLATPPVPPASARRVACVACGYMAVVAISSAAMPASSPPPAASPEATPAQSAPRQAPADEWLVNTGEHFEIFYERQQENRLDEVRRQAEDAYARISSRLKHDLSERVALILVRRNRDFADKVLRANERVRLSGAPARHHLVISTESLDTRAGIIIHELTHHFAFDIIPGLTEAAPWLVEGLAEHERGLWDAVDYRKVHDDVAAGRIPGLESLTGDDRHWGHALFDYVAGAHGAEGVRRLLFSLRTRPQANEAIPVAFDVTLDDFRQSFRTYVTARFGER